MNNENMILIVDDDSIFCKAMKRLLEKSGCRAAVVGDGQEAIDFLAKHPVNLIVSEVKMPQFSGIEFMEEIKRREIDAPVIFITAWGEIESYMELMNMGAFDYLNKPLMNQEILSVVKRAMQSRGA